MNVTTVQTASGGLESGGRPSSTWLNGVESIAVLTTKVQAGGAPGLGRNARPHPCPPHEDKNDDIDYQWVVPIWIQGPKARKLVWGNSLPLGRGRVFGSVIRCLGASGWRMIVMGDGPGGARPQMAREFSGVMARANCRPRRARVGAGCPLWSRREIAGFPESGCGFVLYDADGEWLMRHECPEIARGDGGGVGGVKAVPQARDRSPSPGKQGSTLASTLPRSGQGRR